MLRGAALALTLLLLLNPGIPGSDPVGRAHGVPSHWVLVDLHPALAARMPDGTTQIELLREELRRNLHTDASGRVTSGVARAGRTGPEGVDLEGEDELIPDAVPGDIAGALLRLAEAGADSITLLSPLRGDPDAIAAAIATLPIPVRVVRVGGEVRNAAIIELELPVARDGADDDARSGAVIVAGEGGGMGDSALVTVLINGAEHLRSLIPLPEVGTRRRVPFELPAGIAADPIVIEARVSLDADAFTADDARERSFLPAMPGTGILLLSLRPDGEPRILLPVLDRATGLPTEGWLRIGEDRFLAIGRGVEPVRTVDAPTLSGAIGRARLVVLHGAGAAEPIPAAWMGEIDAHPALLVLPAPAPGEGEGRLDPLLPPSPLSAWLGGLIAPGSEGSLPPLAPSVAPPFAPAAGSGREVLRVRWGSTDVPGATPPGTSGSSPVLLLVEEDGRRRAVAVATGFHRWAVRDGAPAALYRALWAGTAAWLLDAGEGGDREGDTEGAVGAPDVPSPARLALLDPPVDVSELEARVRALFDAADQAPVARAPGRSLRSHPLPWLLIALLLCAEWALRRRSEHRARRPDPSSTS